MIWLQNDIGSKDRATGSHQRAWDIFSPLFERQRIEVGLTHEMEFADFYFCGNGPKGPGTLECGIERKALGDMLHSIRTSRFSGHQLPGLLETYDIAWLVVEGHYRCEPETGVLQQWGWDRAKSKRAWVDVRLGSTKFMHAELERFLLSVSIMTACEWGKPLHIWRTRTPEETVRMISDLYILLTRKAWEDHRSHLGIQMPEIREPVLMRQRTKAEEKELKRRKVVMALECGIGQEKSIAVARHFPSVRAMVNAEEKELRTIDGIGKGIAAKFVEEVS